jgi:cytochrome c-type biogenesis protein CcmH
LLTFAVGSITPAARARTRRSSRPARAARAWRALALTAFTIAALALSARPTPAPEASPSASAPVRAGYDKVSNELLCYCGCARQTIRDCTCGIAFDLRDHFEKRLASGDTAEAIIAEYIAEHGEQARNVPPKRGLNLLAWFGPGIAIVIAAGLTILTIGYWAKRGRPAAQPAAAGDAAPTADEEASRRKLESDLKEFDL